MKIEDFCNEIKEALELDENINADTDLTEFPEYDSLSKLSIIAIIDDNFGVKLSGEKLKSITTVQSLMEAIGKDKFSE